MEDTFNVGKGDTYLIRMSAPSKLRSSKTAPWSSPSKALNVQKKKLYAAKPGCECRGRVDLDEAICNVVDQRTQLRHEL